VLLLIGVTATVVSVVKLNEASDTIVDRIAPARLAASRLATAYVDQESAVRGYLLTRQEPFLEPYEEGKREEADSLAALRQHLADYPDLLTAVDAVAAAGERWRSDFAVPVQQVAEGGQTRPDEATGKALFDAVRTTVEELNRRLEAERTEARDNVNNALQRLEILFALAMLAICLAGLLIWQNLRRTVLTPLDSLAGEARAVADGDFRRRVEVTGPAEIEALARDVEEMRRRIVAAYEESETARDELRAQADLLAVQADDLRRSNDELEQFAYVASHDLQEPLRKVASFCQMLERRYKGQLDERADQYIEFAVDGAKRMQLLINDLLAFSRVGRTSAGMTEVDCNTIARRAADTLATAALEADADIVLGDLPVVHGDETLLTQLLQNLLGNAMKFRSPDRKCRVELTAEREGDDWHFRCADNGIGIEPQYAERIFVIFQRLHSKDQYAGTGIGLSLCKKIVEYHGGRIWLDTGRVDGSTVHWTLPVGSGVGDGDDGPGSEPEAVDE
jgi:signal transduction histidine kinase